MTTPAALPPAQAEAVLAALRAFERFGVEPCWHVNRCGCCVAVHAHADHSAGYLIGRDGSAEWLDLK